MRCWLTGCPVPWYYAVYYVVYLFCSKRFYFVPVPWSVILRIFVVFYDNLKSGSIADLFPNFNGLHLLGIFFYFLCIFRAFIVHLLGVFGAFILRFLHFYSCFIPVSFAIYSPVLCLFSVIYSPFIPLFFFWTYFCFFYGVLSLLFHCYFNTKTPFCCGRVKTVFVPFFSVIPLFIPYFMAFRKRLLLRVRKRLLSNR